MYVLTSRVAPVRKTHGISSGWSAPNCGARGDQANTAVTVQGSVSGTFDGSPDACTAGAMGYNKQ